MTRADLILDELSRVRDRDGFDAHGIHVRIGEHEAERFWRDDVPRDIHSIAKGVCVLAAGIAVDEGVFDLDAPVAHYLPHLTLGDGVEAVSIRHLLGMVSGIDMPWSPTEMTDWPDLAAEFLGRPSRGRVFQYANVSTYTAMRALAAVVGDVALWLQPRLFEPLGIENPHWDRCPNGWIVAGGGLHLRLGELARIGALIRDDGRWRGRRLVSESGVRAMHSDWSEHDAPPAYRRYALAGWGGPGEAWRLHGAHGQLLVFVGDAVVTVVADDHAGADLMAERIEAVLTKLTPDA